MKGSKLKFLFIGAIHPDIMILAKNKGLDATFTGYVRRKEIRTLACQAKIGVCCSEGDSSPRIIPEMLAMGLPVIVRRVHNFFYHERLFGTSSLVGADEESFVDILNTWVTEYTKFDAREFYKTHLSLDISTSLLADAIREIFKHKLRRPILAKKVAHAAMV
jgi:glycosyltransferase involved in cell wall biosynthesis